MNKLRFIIFITLVFTGQLLVSCAKDGEMGPHGTDGIDGKDGVDGVDGKPGTDGVTIVSGFQDPDTSKGKNGDFYLNLSSKRLFGPKENNQWSNSIDLSGEAGTDGTDGTNGTNGKDGRDGATIVSRHGTPSMNDGKIGDFFLNLSNFDFYGPKLSTWGTPMSLKPDNALTKRVLLKQDLGFELCSNCYNYSTDWYPGHSTFSVTTPYVELNVGDISGYYSKGRVIYEVRVNGREWITLDETSNKPYIYNYAVGNREYDIMFIPISIEYYAGKLSFPTSTGITLKGVHSMQSLIDYLKAEAKIDVRITLLPNESVEIISEAYPNLKVDNKFISKYLSLQN